MIISYSDIGQYQTCPLLFTKFKENIKHDIDDETKFLEDNFIRIIVKSAEHGYVPVFKQLSPLMSADVRFLKDSGLSQREINSYLLTIREAIVEYKQKLFDFGYRPVGFDFDAYLAYMSLTYQETIPIIMVNSSQELIPVYFARIIQNPHRNNLIRFNAAALQEMTGFQISHFIVINVYKGGVNISRYNHRTGEIDRAKKELINILREMNNLQQTPNTNHCKDCKVNRICRL